MKKPNDQEINLFRFIERVRDEADNCIIRWLSASDYRDIVSKLCLKCFKPADEIEDCDLCNSHTETTNEQLYLNFEGLEEENNI